MRARRLCGCGLLAVIVIGSTASPAGAQAPTAPSAPSVASRQLIEAAKSADKAAVAAALRQRPDVNAAEPDGTTALHWAVRVADAELVDQLLRAGAKANPANRYGITPLYLACVNGSETIIALLVKSGADPAAPGPEGETPLMTAARSGNVAAAAMLLDNGAAVDARETWRGQTALMWAAAQDHPDMARMLIKRGADVNARSRLQSWERQRTDEPREKWLPAGNLTPLMFAARQGALATARVLVEARADVNAVDPEGMSAVVTALINGHYDVAGFLLDEGTDPNLADETGRTALYAAADMNTMPASNRPSPKVAENRLTSLDIIQKLLARGANVNAQMKAQQPYRTKLDRGNDTVLAAGTTALIRTAKGGDVEATRVLLAAGADPKLATRNGVTALMAAAGVGTKEEDTTGRSKTEAQTIEVLTLLLQAGADVDAAESRGLTALHGAALQGYDQVIRFLASKGATLDVKDQRGFTPLDAAAGLAGGVGFDGRASNPHESTAAVLRELLAAPTAKLSPPSTEEAPKR